MANIDTVRSSFQVSQEQLNLILNDPATTQTSQPDVIDEIIFKANKTSEPQTLSVVRESKEGTVDTKGGKVKLVKS